MYKKAAAVLSLMVTLSLCAQEVLVTDRPDFTESAQVVPLKSLQIEMGLEWGQFEPTRVLTWPNTLFRVGLFEKLELRVELPGWTNWENADALFEDPALGFKWQITGDDAVVPAALLVHAALPAGDHAVRGEAGDFDLLYAGAFDLNARAGLSWNLGFASARGPDDDREWSQKYSLALGLGLTDILGCYFETMGEFDPEGNWAPVVDGGVTFAAGPLVQLDGYVAVGLSDYAPDLLIGLGASFRFFR